MKRRKSKKQYFTTQAASISFFSKVVLVVLIVGMIMGHLNLGALVKAFEPDVYTHINEDINRDFSEFDKIEELVNLRTPNSKTYIKENGMYETEYFGEKVHYKDNDKWEEIDNTLSLKDNKYSNKSNKYNVSFPNKLNKNNEVVLEYLNNEIKIYYDTKQDIVGQITDKIDRKQKNLKDSISYVLNAKEKIEYVVQQDSIKENIILYSYIANYEYSYYIDTELRVERIGNELYFYDGSEEVFVMDEYYMYDSNNNSSKDIDFEINVIDEDTYRIDVTPDDEYLKSASYPVVIDPEIRLIDGGLIDGITTLYSIDKQAGTSQFLTIGSFTVANRVASNTNDDKIGYLEIYIPRNYDKNIGDIITQNQLMYANLTLTTVSTNAIYDTKVNLNYVNSMSGSLEDGTFSMDTEFVDSESFHNSNVFNHKFDILAGITERLEQYKTSDISMGFEISIDGVNYTEISYGLGWDLGGNKPIITLGYMADAGLADYYTYESLPVSDDSNVYISHNSGNLTYLYNDYNDGNLLSLTHIYNANRKHNGSQYGNGFSLNYNEFITTYYSASRVLLTEGDGREVLYYTKNDNNTEYIASDGSGDVLYRVLDSSGSVTGFKVETSDGGLKLYDSSGKLINIFVDKDEYVNGLPTSDAKYITISYNTDGTISRVDDSSGNYMTYNYSTIDNDPTTNQTDIPYLAYINIYKQIPNGSNGTRLEQVEYLEYEYDEGNLSNIAKFGTSSNGTYTYLNYNEDNHIEKIYKNNRGYEFIYDIKNRITRAEVYSTEFSNGDFLELNYDSNGKKTVITNGSGDSTSYTFDDYYHTNSVETSSGYTTFYKYEDIYYDSNGNTITSPNYNLNHKIILQSNSFKNVSNLITNHGFEIEAGNGVFGWTKEVTSNSTASINNSIYLYGSRVLELKKTSNGTAKVYQEIPVESGKTYIVTGYIRNGNTLGTGAYIEATGIGGTLTYVSSSNKVKNTINFVRYEYKFIANYTGQAKIYLVNNSTGKAYFDNIQVNTNYLDTRYNYLENSSFELDTYNDFVENNEISGWNAETNFSLKDQNEYFSDNCGNKSLKLGYNGSVTQTINAPGLAGDTFVFGGYCFYENYTGDVSVTFDIITENGGVSKTFTFDANEINATYMMNKLTIEEDYSSISITIRNDSITSDAFVDNFAIYKEGYGVNLTYNDNGDVTTEYDEFTDSTTTYSYDANGNVTQVATNNDETNYTYDSNDYLNSVKNQNIVTSFETDEDGNITEITSDSENDTNEIGYYFGSTTYTADGLYPVTETDVFGNITTYDYDYITGLVNSIIDSNDISTEYTYDKDGNVLSIINGKGTNKKIITYTYDVYGNVTSISNGSLVYTFTYNSYGDIKTIKVGSTVLLQNNYKNENSTTEIYTGELLESVYSYGTISFEYNDNHQIEKVYNGTGSSKYVVLEYTYNDYGEIASYTDYKENVTYYYNYDYQNRLINVNSTNGNNITYSYDDDSNLVSKTNINGTNSYTYNDLNTDTEVEDNKLTNESISGQFTIDYEYSSDSYRQLQNISYYLSTCPIIGEYTYETVTKNEVAGNETVTKTYYTGRIKELEYLDGDNQIIRYVYTYDDYSNITLIEGYEGTTLVYFEENYYDIFNQIIGQRVQIEDSTYLNEYGYDSRGNVIGYYSQTANGITYSGEFWYNNNDEMTSALINGTTYNISYSTAGQPNIYLGWTIEYDMRSISVLENDDYYIEYYYNADGIRIGKSIDNENTIEDVSYILEGNNIIREVRTGTNNYTINYFYDSNDNIIGFTYNNNKYLYMKNLQNDIIGIVDSNNDIVVKYYYDAYGRIIKTEDTSNINLSTINPFRYRSYYQDNETAWYYLNSRYYNPLTNRFITMDEVEYLTSNGTINSLNLFLYCENNPIINVDDEGNFPVHIIAGVAIGIAWGVIPRIITDVIRGRMSKISDYLCDAFAGGVSGLITSLTGSSTIGTLVGTFLGEMIRFLIDYGPKLKLGNFKEIVIELCKVVLKTAIATISSLIAGKLVQKLSGKSFSSKQIKTFFKNTKYLKSAFGIGSGGKTARRMWFADAGITTALNKLFTLWEG